MLPARDVLSRHEAGGQQDRREGRHQVLRPLGVHHADGRHEVGQDHEGEEDEDVVVEVGGEEGENEASGDDVEGREEETAGSLAAEVYS